MTQCDSCVYWAYDENEEDYFCMAFPDEDDVARMAFEDSLSFHKKKECPYYRLNDEYKTARMQ